MGRDKNAGGIDDAIVDEWFEDEDEGAEEANTPVVPTKKTVEEKYAESQLRVVRSTIDFSIYSLKQNFFDSNYINIAPEYQRRHRWDRKKRSQLIESILMNIPIPPLFLFENEYNKYEVMDGRQRLDTVVEFLENGFSLSGLEFWTELNGRRFKELSETLQRGLMRRTLSAIVLLAETKTYVEEESDIRMILFRRLNTGGVMLNPHELRNALYPSPFAAMLRDAARGKIFTSVWEIPEYAPDEKKKIPEKLLRNSLYKAMADCELVLRFFALREMMSENLRGSLRKLLDNSMKRHIKDSHDEVLILRKDFDESLSILNDVFDGRPFRLEGGRLSRPLYDALMVSINLHPQNDISKRSKVIKESLTEALKDEDTYEILIGRGNTIDAIKERINLATSILSEK